MKCRAAIFSMVTLGLCAVPVFAHAQGADDTATFPLSSLLPSLPMESRSAKANGAAALFLRDAGVYTLSPGLNLPAGSSARTSATLPSVPINALNAFHSNVPGSQGSKSIQVLSSGGGSPAQSDGSRQSPAATPEPGTMALMIGGAFGGAVALRRRKK